MQPVKPQLQRGAAIPRPPPKSTKPGNTGLCLVLEAYASIAQAYALRPRLKQQRDLEGGAGWLAIVLGR
jgi:hypothetical protein